MATTIYTATGFSGTPVINYASFRMKIALLGGALDQVRVTINIVNTGVALIVDHVSIGIATGTYSNTTATPVELLFGGGHGFTDSGSGGDHVSDWTNFNGFTGSDSLVIDMDVSTGAGGSGFNFSLTDFNCEGFEFSTNNLYATASPGAPDLGDNIGYNWGLSLVEVQSTGAAGVRIGWMKV